MNPKKRISWPKSAALFCAAAFGLSAWAATPLAVWNGDFDTATTRNGVTFSANNNTINADGTVTIASGSTTGISFDLPATYDYVTAVFTVTGVTGKTAANAVLVSTKSGNSAYGGVYVKSGSLGTGGINGTTAWSITSADGTITSYDDTNTTDVNEDATAERTFAVTQVNSDRVQNGMHLFEIVGGGTDATVVFGSNGNNGLRYALGYNVITIGGFQTTPSETGAIGTMEGLTLKSVAIYASNKSWPLDGTGRANFAMPLAFNISGDTSLSTINAAAADYTDNVFVNFTADGLFLTADAGAASNVILPYDTTATVADGTLTLAGDLPVKLGSSITAVEGSGTVVAVGVTEIDALPSGAFSSDAWTGTVWLKGRTGWTNIVPTNYGNAGSTLRFSGISGYFAKAQYNASATPAFELENDSYDYGYTITDGYSFNSNGSYSYFQTKTLKGSGSLISNAKGGGLISVTENWGEFTGSINLSNRTIWLGFTDAPNSSSSTDTTFGVIGGTIRLNNVDVTPGAAWTFASGGGFVGAGTVHLAYPWYGTANCGTNSRWEGTIELAAYTATQNVAINLAYMGNANSTIVLKGLSSTAASNIGPYIEPANGSTVTATVQLDGDVTFGAANSGKTQTLNKITGTGNLNFFYTGSHTYNILDVSGYTGTIAAKANSTVYVGVSTAPAVGDRIAKLDSSNHNVSTTVNVNNSDIGVRGELTTVDEVYGLYATTAATVGEDAYASLDAAIAAAGEGGTVTLSRDITLATLAVADDVTINVGSHTLTATTLTVDEDATVTIAGTGTLTASSATVSGEVAFANAGTFSLTGSAASSIAALTADAAMTFWANCNVTVGEITANADMTFAATLVNTTALTKKGTGTLNFYGVTAPTAGIVIEGGEVAINNTLDGISPAVWLDASDATTITETDGKVTAWASSVNNYNFTNETSAMTYEDAEGVFGGQKVVRTNNSQLEADFSDAHETYSVFAAAHYYSNSGTGGILCYRSGANNCYFGKRNTKDQFWSSLRTSSTPVSLWQNGSTSSVNFSTADKILSNASWYNSSATVNHVGGTSGDIAIAEFIGLSSDPSMANRKRIEAYLGNKWSVDGMVSLATAVPVTLSNGAVLDLGGLERTVASISGSGTVANGTLTVTDPISLSAGEVLTLPATATFTLDTVAAKIVSGDSSTVTLYGSLADAIVAQNADSTGTLTITASATDVVLGATEIAGVTATLADGVSAPTFAANPPYSASYTDGTIANARVASTYVWTPADASTDWASLSNWRIGGVAPATLPGSSDTVEFPTSNAEGFTGWTVVLDSMPMVGAVVVNGDTAFSGARIQVKNGETSAVTGTGTITLGDNAGFYPGGENDLSLTVENNLKITASENAPAKVQGRVVKSSSGGATVRVNGNLTGTGWVEFGGTRSSTYLNGDNTEFAGHATFPDDTATASARRLNVYFEDTSAVSSKAVWTIYDNNGSPLSQSGTQYCYRFGALFGVFNNTRASSRAASWIELGGANVNFDVVFNGVDHNDREDKIRKVGTGTMTLNAGSSRISEFVLNGGSIVVMAGVADTVASDVTTEVAGYEVVSTPNYDTDGETVLSTTYTLAANVASVTHGETVTPCTTLAGAITAAQSGDTVTLLADVDVSDEGVTFPASTTLTLDLNGCTLTAANTATGHIQVNGALTITDNSVGAAGKIVSGTSGTYGVVQVAEKDVTGASLTIAGGAIEAYFEGETDSDGQHPAYGVVVKGTGTTFTMTGGSIKAGYMALMGHGSKASAGTYNISGGTITSMSDFAAYFPTKGDCAVTISGGTFSGLGGVSARAGTVTITGGVFTASGAGTAPGSAPGTTGLGFMALAVTPNYGNVTVSVSGGKFTSATDVAAVMATTSTYTGSISLTGGTYSTDVSDYCATGYEATEDSGVWTVALAQNTGIDPTDENSSQEVTVDTSLTAEEQVAAAIAAATVTVPDGVSGVDAATYKTYFTYSATPTATAGTYDVAITGFADEVTETADGNALSALEAATAGTALGSITVKPGLYYGTAAGADVTTLKASVGELNTTGKLDLSGVTKPSTGEAFFIKIKVSTTAFTAEE